MSKRSHKSSNDERDDPPMSRLFVVCSKNNTESEFLDAFGKYGQIEDCRIVKDRDGNNKGVAYVKFSRTSEAARACEALNGQLIGQSSRPIKVLIAASRNTGSSSSKSREDEKAQRLFIIIAKGTTESDLHNVFDQYGEIEDITIIRDRKTKEGKGFAYIKFKKFSYAALAFENCDENYKAVFAEPKPPRSSSLSNDSGSISSSNPPEMDRYGGLDMMTTTSSDCALHVICSPMITHDQLWRLFDIVPNMDYCKMNTESDFSSSATVVYKTQQAAMHARQKLHGFEYPIGERLIVKLSSEMKSTPINDTQGFFNSSNGSNFCSVNLPNPQALAPSHATCVQRCFIVCSPHVLPVHVLKKVFSRFGNLIDVYLLSNRNCGYAKYASHESARQAMKILHGAEIYGVKLKVLEAEEQSESRKRSKIDLD